MTQENTQNQKELIVLDQSQSDNIVLDLDTNQIKVNQQFRKSLQDAPKIIAQAEKMVNTDVKDLSEDDMYELRKNFKPVIKYKKQYDEFEKTAKKMLKERDQALIDNYHKILTNAGYDKIPQLVKQFRVMDKDFKANRANQRWEQLHQRFEAAVTSAYPEFRQFAPHTLGSFNYFRLHHPKMVSESKTKPINKATIALFNQELQQYHEDMQRLLKSTLTPNYYPKIIEQYADDPTTSKMLNLIDQGLAQQIKDQQAKLVAQVRPTIEKLLPNLWYNNDKINNFLNQPNQKATKPIDQTKYELGKLKLMKSEADAIVLTLKPEEFIDTAHQKIDEESLTLTLKSLLTQATQRIYRTLTDQLALRAKPQPAPKPAAKTPDKPEQKQAQPAQPKPQTPAPTEPYSWVLDYLQANHQADVHNNPKEKVAILNDIFQNLTNRDSIWRSHVKSYDDILALVQYIINM